MDYLYISSNILLKDFYYNIFDLNGSLVLSDRVVEKRSVINLSFLNKGVYFIFFNNQDVILRKKLIIY